MASDPAAWTAIDDGIHVRQSRAFWMNSTVLLDSEHTVLVDPGVLPSELDEMARLVNQAEPEAVTVIFTHAHWDHVLGRGWWPKARVVAHDRCAAEMARDLEKIRSKSAALAAEYGEAFAAPFALPAVHDASSGQRFLKLDPWRLVLREAPGHCASQLTVHIPERRLLIAADMLSDIEIPILNTAPAVYRGTLETLKPLAEGGAFEMLIPGHGGIALGREEIAARVGADLEYLGALERGALEARAAGLDRDGCVKQLEGIEYTGKHSETYSMVETHRKNVEFAWDASLTAR